MSARSVSSLPLISEPTLCMSSQTSSSVPLSQSYSRCDELRVRIHENHLSYLNREETPAKLEMRTKIECLIAEYLSLVPNTHKFSFYEVSQCLNRSITENQSFSAYKASNAFEALEKYATNLITLPWRQEYHSICPYSGFYRHVIDKHLIGAQNILFLMGFVENRTKGIYQLVPPIDPDRVSRVSLECLVAFVELQIMIQIRESLKSKGFSNISWKEIHAIRVEYVCGQSDAIKLIAEMKRTAKLIDYDNSNVSNGAKRLVSTDSQTLSNGFSLMDDNICSPKQSIREKHLSHNYIDNSYHDFEDNTESFDLLNYPIISGHSFPLSPSCQYCLPQTSSLQLSPCPQPHVTYCQPIFTPFPTNSQSCVAPKTQSFSKGVQANTADLPSLSNDIENSFNKISVSNKKSMSEIDGLLAKPKTSSTKRDNTTPDNRTKRGSYYDNLDPLLSLEPAVLSEFMSVPNDKKIIDKKSPTTERSHNSLEKKKSLIDGKSLSKIVNSVKLQSNPLKFNTNSNKNANEVKNSNTNNGSIAAIPQSSSTSNVSPNIGKTRTDESKADNIKQTRDLKGVKGWSCTSCTYLNSEPKDVCEMCHRSRKVGAESMPLVSGGRECSRCTLVNDKNEKFCRACDTSLADSPTYI